MVPGEVVLWPLFDHNTRGGPPKDRYIVFLGQTGLYICPAYVFVVTPTTCLEHYTESGDRAGRKVVRFEPGPDCPFPATCLIDVEFDAINIPQEDVTAVAGVVTSCGQLPASKLLEIWKIVEGSGRFSGKVKKDIHDCLSKAGIIR